MVVDLARRLSRMRQKYADAVALAKTWKVFDPIQGSRKKGMTGFPRNFINVLEVALQIVQTRQKFRRLHISTFFCHLCIKLFLAIAESVISSSSVLFLCLFKEK
jgi:hypothetical protein